MYKRLFGLLLIIILGITFVSCASSDISNTIQANEYSSENIDAISPSASESIISQTSAPTTEPTAIPTIVQTATPTPAPEPQSYPLKDKESKYMLYASEFPQIAYSTGATENGLGGNVYYVRGKVIGFYDKMEEVYNNLGIENVGSLGDTEIIIIENKNGRALFINTLGIQIQNIIDKYGEDSTELNMQKQIYGEYEDYTEFPGENEECIVYGVYSGYSSVFDMPVLYYGICDAVYDFAHMDDVKKTYTEQFVYNEIELEIPKSWGEEKIVDDNLYFYPENAMIMFARFQTPTDGELNEESAYLIMASLGEGFADMCINSFEKKMINSEKTMAFIFSFEGKLLESIDMEVIQVLFEANGSIYALSFCYYKGGFDSQALLEYNTVLDSVTVKKQENSDTIKVDYPNEELFEDELNDGKDLIGKTVSFVVKKIAPESVFGFNLQAGEHLNFCSDFDPGVKEGNTITVKVTDYFSFLGSWIISYEIIND